MSRSTARSLSRKSFPSTFGVDNPVQFSPSPFPERLFRRIPGEEKRTQRIAAPFPTMNVGRPHEPDEQRQGHEARKGGHGRHLTPGPALRAR